MTDPGQFGANKPGPLDCAAAELWLAESAEKTLPSAIAEQLHTHATGCAACREKLVQTRHGRQGAPACPAVILSLPKDRFRLGRSDRTIGGFRNTVAARRPRRRSDAPTSGRPTFSGTPTQNPKMHG